MLGDGEVDVGGGRGVSASKKRVRSGGGRATAMDEARRRPTAGDIAAGAVGVSFGVGVAGRRWKDRLLRRPCWGVLWQESPLPLSLSPPKHREYIGLSPLFCRGMNLFSSIVPAPASSSFSSSLMREKKSRKDSGKTAAAASPVAIRGPWRRLATCISHTIDLAALKPGTATLLAAFGRRRGAGATHGAGEAQLTAFLTPSSWAVSCLAGQTLTDTQELIFTSIIISITS